MNQDQRNVILTIREYENSVEMPDEERVTYLDPRGGVHLKEGDGLADRFKYVHWAERCAEYLRFGDEVDTVTCGEYPRTSALKICDTPQLYIEAGFKPLPMLYTQRHLLDAIRPKDEDHPHRHGLSVAQVKRIPELLADPVMLYYFAGWKDHHIAQELGCSRSTAQFRRATALLHLREALGEGACLDDFL